MSKASVQSRKICFVDVEPNDRVVFDEALSSHEVVFVRKLDAVPEDAEIVSVFITERVEDDFLEAHPKLRLICSRSTGCDHIDLEACRRRDIPVTNVGTYGENTVAEHTFALILALSRRLRQSHSAVRSGRFTREHLRGFDLRNRTLGVIGAGRVGLHVIRIAAGFGMKILAHDSERQPFLTELLDFKYVPLEEVFRESHVITLHVPLDPSTRHMINRKTLKHCRPGVLIINTGRGALMDTEAVIEALDSGQVGGLGLDVLEDERVFKDTTTSLLGEKIAERVRNTEAGAIPREPSAARLAEFSRLVTHSRLLQRQDVILTPHVAFNSLEAVACLQKVTVENITAYIEGKPLLNICP
jgi:D-lactate dehydrogenase